MPREPYSAKVQFSKVVLASLSLACGTMRAADPNAEDRDQALRGLAARLQQAAVRVVVRDASGAIPRADDGTPLGRSIVLADPAADHTSLPDGYRNEASILSCSDSG